MKTVLLNSTAMNSIATAMGEGDEDISEGRDSCYYPECRKNTNCSCRMCLASISATLDLMPVSVQKSSLTKLSASRPTVQTTPLSFDASVLSTPVSSHRRIIESPNFRPSGRSLLSQKADKPRKRDLVLMRNFLNLVLVLIFVFALDSGFSWAVSELLQPKLSSAMVRKMGQNSAAIYDLNGKLTSFQIELQTIAEGKVSNCSSFINSLWEIKQEGNLLHSKCIFYKSSIEEVSLWGWPLQTAGLLTAGFSHRSFTVLSGRLTQWPDGTIGYTVRKANSSWMHGNWAASAVHLDSNTWILEYNRNWLFVDKSRRYSALMELLRYKISTMVERLKEELFVISAVDSSWYGQLKKKKKGNIRIPT